MTTTSEIPNDGGPAFPAEQHECQDNSWNQTFSPGMTLRDYFAASALMALNVQAHVAPPAAEYLAYSAYNIADAMLKVRER